MKKILSVLLLLLFVGLPVLASPLMMRGMGKSSPAAPPFDPSTVAGLKVWLKGDIVSGDTWTDQSGLGNNFTGVTGLQVSNVINGHAVIRTANHSTAIPSTFDLNDAASSTIFVVCKPADTGWGEIIGTAGDTWYLAFFGGNSTIFRTWTNTSANFFDHGTLTDYTTAFFYYTINVNETTGANGTTDLRQSGVAKSSSPSRGRGNFGSLIIGDARPSTQGIQGDIAEILIYDAAITGTDRTNIENYLKDRFAL